MKFASANSWFPPGIYELDGVKCEFWNPASNIRSLVVERILKYVIENRALREEFTMNLDKLGFKINNSFRIERMRKRNGTNNQFKLFANF